MLVTLALLGSAHTERETPMTASLQPTDPLDLTLADLRTGFPGITPAFGASLEEAASVCLDDRGHADPTAMPIEGDIVSTASVRWSPPSDQALRCWGDREVTTEHGAYGIAALILPKVSPLRIIERARKGKGFDFWLGSQEDEATLFQNKARLEVSGIRSGTSSDVSARVRQKRRQIDGSAGSLPGLVVVVEFGEPRSRLVRK